MKDLSLHHSKRDERWFMQFLVPPPEALPNHSGLVDYSELMNFGLSVLCSREGTSSSHPSLSQQYQLCWFPQASAFLVGS